MNFLIEENNFVEAFNWIHHECIIIVLVGSNDSLTKWITVCTNIVCLRHVITWLWLTQRDVYSHAHLSVIIMNTVENCIQMF